MATDRGLVGLGNAGESFDDFGRGRHYESINRAGFDANERVKVLDSEGIDIAVMYPGLGLKLGAILDPDLAVASCQVYNDWVAEWCSAAPGPVDRHRCAAAAGSEARGRRGAAHRGMGLKAGFARPNAYNDRPLHHPVYTPVWEALEETGLPIAFHPAGPRRHARRVAPDGSPHGAGHAPRAHPPVRPGDDALEPRVRRRPRTPPELAGRRARVRRRMDRALDGPARRVPRELRLGDTAPLAHAARVLQAPVLDQLRSRRAHRATARRARRWRSLRLGVRLPAQRREVSGRRRRAARAHRGDGTGPRAGLFGTNALAMYGPGIESPAS